MITFGIDVGVTGAIAAITDQGELRAVFDLPVMSWGKTKWIDGVRLLGLIRAAKGTESARAFVELVHAMPAKKGGEGEQEEEGKKFGGGTVAAMKKGLCLGSILVVLQFASVPSELVTPSSWKRALGLINPGATDTEKKHAGRCRAQMLFPKAPLDRQKDHNRAEALLIAHYGLRLAKPTQVAA